MDIKTAKLLEVGDTVFMTEQQAQDNYGKEYIGQPLTISHIATSKKDHPGYDGQDGEPLFDFEELEFSLYSWEIQDYKPYF